MKKHFLSMLRLWVCLVGGAFPAGAWKDIKIDLTNGNLHNFGSTFTKLKLSRIALLLLFTVCSVYMQAAKTVTLPSSSILFSDADLVKCNSENDGVNVGSTGAKTTMTFVLQNNTAGDYILSLKSGAKDLEAVYNISIKNSSNTEVFNKDFTVSNTGSWTPTENHAMILSNLEAGSLTMVISVKSTTGSYAGNLGALSIVSADDYDHIPGSITLSKGTYNNGTRVESKGNVDNVGNIKNNGTATYYFINTKEGSFNLLLDILRYSQGGTLNIAITDAETGKNEFETDYTIAADAPGKYTTNTIAIPNGLKKGIKTMKFTFSNGNGYICNYQNVKLEYTGEAQEITDVVLNKLTIDGESNDIYNTLNEAPYAATISGVYTALPTVTAELTDGSSATVSSVLNDDKTTAVYTISGTVGNKTREFKLTIEGLNIYTPTENDETVTLKYSGSQKTDDNTWSNGLYTLISDNGLDGWNNSSFKLNGNNYTLKVPSNVKVKQVILKDFNSNYAPANGAALTSMASDGATVFIPTKSTYNEPDATAYDLVINLYEHKAGNDITFNIQGGGQPVAYFELTIEKVATTTAPVLLSSSVTNTDNANHCVVALNFDREMRNTTVNFNGQEVTAKGGTTTLYFSLWNLDYNKDYTFEIAKGLAKDIYNNGNDAISIPFHVGSKAVAEQATYDYVVSNADELDAAIKELQTTNKTADAERKTVFLKNGKYTYGTLTGSYQHNVSFHIDNWNDIYNVSLIGESKDGVLIEGTTDGITSSTFELGKGTGNYLQDLTIRNNYDFRAETFKGVSCAVTGGNKTILKNVAMQASQDTYVTGDRTYLEDCDIYGTTDFICGGGDIFFERCNLILGNKSGNVIVAPNTQPSKEWGYVLNNCTVKADEGATNATDKSWNLGRPWDNEPRAYYLNTKMEVLCSDAGWTSMGKLTTHFYEYNSVDRNGNKIDLSKRQNSPTSLNTYTPVLTDAEAKEFTVHNVLGGTDAWDAASYTIQTSKPELTYTDGTLKWNPMTDARCYAIFKNGEYVANTTSCEYTTNDMTATWTVRAANEMGGLGEAAEAKAITAKLSAGGMGTFCSATGCKAPDGLDVYTASVSGNTVTLNKVSNGIIPAGEGVVLAGEASKTYYMTPCEAEGKLEGNSLKGTLDKTLIENSYSYVLVYDKAEAVSYFKNFQNGAYMPAGKAYLEIPAAAQNSILKVVINNGGTNGINTVGNDDAQTGDYYTLSGLKTLKPQKGIFIHNGKKIIMK